MARRLTAALAAFIPMVSITEDPCRRTPNGVLCDEVGFTALVRGCVTDRRDRELAVMAQHRAEADLADALRLLAEAEERLKAPPPAVEPPRSVRPLVTFTLGVVGASLAATAAAWSSAPAGVRAGLGAAGAVAGVGGLWFAW